MKPHALALMALMAGLSGCGMTPVAVKETVAAAPPFVPTVTSVSPNASGAPNTVLPFGKFSFVSVQGTGQIFSYEVLSGAQIATGPAYATPCSSPSGMQIANIAGVNVMAVVCYDTDSLLTLAVHADGSLSPLGSVRGLPTPFPGAVLNGTDVFVPLYGRSLVANGGVARVSIASPAQPIVTGVAMLTSPMTGGFANPGYMAYADGHLFIAAGSESGPQDVSSTIQVVDAATMTVVGKPLVVAHSPQQIAILRRTVFVTFYDAAELESIDITDPAALKPLQVLSTANPGATCHSVPLATRQIFVYIGCYAEGTIQRYSISDPSNMQLTQTIPNIVNPQRLEFVDHYLLATSGTLGGAVYEIDTGPI